MFSILKVLIILHLAEQITNGSTGFATDKCNRFITFNMGGNANENILQKITKNTSTIVNPF